MSVSQRFVSTRNFKSNVFMSKTIKQPDPIDIHVGSRIRLQRNMRNITQQQLSKRLGITFQQVQKYEKGINRVGASRLQMIAEILDVPVSFFFSDPEDKAVLTETAGFAEDDGNLSCSPQCSSQEGMQLIRAFSKIRDPRVRRKIIDLTATLAGEKR